MSDQVDKRGWDLTFRTRLLLTMCGLVLLTGAIVVVVAESLEQLANQGLAMEDLDRLAAQLLAFLKGNPGMTWVLYGDESGDYAGATRLHDGRLHIERTHLEK